jgi:hypothetical protein
MWNVVGAERTSRANEHYTQQNILKILKFLKNLKNLVKAENPKYIVCVLPSHLPQTNGLFICLEDSLPSARRHNVFGYPKQRATVSVGSVLK